MIEIKDLRYRYPNSNREVLQGISLQIREGETVSIMGANGSGKSTLVRCMNGLLQPPAGTVLVDGLDASRSDQVEKIRELVGMVFQNPDNQIVSSTVEREIAFGLENLGVSPAEMHKIVDELLEEFGLRPFRKRSPHYLSGGEKQLLALASVLAVRPRYLVLDEPTSLLDPHWRKVMLAKIFSGLNGRLQRITPILITQFPEETFFTQRLIVLDAGKILAEGRPAQVFSRAALLLQHGIAVPVEYQLGDLGIELEAKY